MPEEESADTERAIRPVMGPGTVDTYTILALHEQVYAALRAGTAPWFPDLLRKPDEVADYTDRGRRKMPALMCGADNSYLALTWRQISTVQRVAEQAMFHAGPSMLPLDPQLSPLNKSAQLNYGATGNPNSVGIDTAIANCCPGLEVDFRAVWRRMFKGVVLREYDNFVVDVDDDAPAEIKNLKGQRLLRIRPTHDKVDDILTTTEMRGPATSDVAASILLTTKDNPYGRAPMEWSNLLAPILHGYQGKTVKCDFSKVPLGKEEIPQLPLISTPEPNYRTFEMQVRYFFEGDTAVISKVLAEPGELTQGLCSPWQNDYRECGCYYWASARPDYINVEPAGNGLSTGDNWLQKQRTGNYVPDDYADSRLILYDDLFTEWEKWLKFQVGGRDAPDTAAPDRDQKTLAKGVS
jgi:hypothetical protein